MEIEMEPTTPARASRAREILDRIAPARFAAGAATGTTAISFALLSLGLMVLPWLIYADGSGVAKFIAGVFGVPAGMAAICFGGLAVLLGIGGTLVGVGGVRWVPLAGAVLGGGGIASAAVFLNRLLG